MNRRFTKIIGCGGVGKGLLFCSSINDTLGRSESRLVTLSDAKDYCKQQIVFYYIAEFLKDRAEVFPIGCVGNDSDGKELIAQMERQGMNVSCMELSDTAPTMISICLQYPDKEGCNFTAQNTASGEVTPQFIENALEKIGVDENTCLVAVPEISVESRVYMVKYGKQHGAYCAISIPAGETEEFEKQEVYRFCDVVSVNEEEAQAITRTKSQGKKLTEELLSYLKKYNPDIIVCVTMGNRGACLGSRERLQFVPAFPAHTVNTTGAGDAFLGSFISGISMGFPIFKDSEDSVYGESVLETVPEFASLCAGMAVENPDSIAENVTKESVLEIITQHGWKQKFF